MARYIKDVDVRQPIDVISILIEDYIYHNHFTRSDWNGEMVYAGKDNHGKMRFFKWTYVNSVLHVEAWIKGAFGGEKSIATGGGSKAEYRESLERLFHRLRGHSGNVEIGDYVGHDPMNHSTPQPVYKQKPIYTTPKSVYTGDTTPTQRSSAGQSALMLSVVAVIFGFMVPLFGLIMGIIAKKRLEQEELDERHRKQVRLLSTLAIVFSIMSFAFAFVFPFIFAADTFFELL